MKIGNFVILPWSRKNFLPRLIAFALALSWLLWGVSIYHEGQQLRARLQDRQRWQQQQQQQLRREEKMRREAAYQQWLLQEKNARQGVQNVMDGFKK